MGIDTLNVVLEEARHLPSGWLDGDTLPLPSVRALQHASDWRATPKGIRQKVIGEAKETNNGETIKALFLLWTWEPESELRAQIVMALPPRDGAAVSNVLRKIYRNETPDDGGKRVRQQVTQLLAEIVKGTERPDSIRTRGKSGRADQGRDEGGKAKELLCELQALQSANPWL